MKKTIDRLLYIEALWLYLRGFIILIFGYPDVYDMTSNKLNNVLIYGCLQVDTNTSICLN